MYLFLDSFGSSLTIENAMFKASAKHQKTATFAADTLRAVFITKGVFLSSDALILAVQHDIPVIFINGMGRSIGQVWLGKFGSISTIRKNQALWSQSNDALFWIRSLLLLKIESQQQLLTQLGEAEGRPLQVMRRVVNQLNDTDIAATDFQTICAAWRGLEGTASRMYWQAVVKRVPPEYGFQNRSGQGAADPFNAALNYTYGILYSLVEVALLRAGIDPAIGVYHIDRHNRTAMVYDVIEPYRVWADETVINLFLQEQLSLADFYLSANDEKGYLRITTEGRQLLATSFLTAMETIITYKNVSRRRVVHLDLDAARIATFLKQYQ